MVSLGFKGGEKGRREEVFVKKYINLWEVKMKKRISRRMVAIALCMALITSMELGNVTTSVKAAQDTTSKTGRTVLDAFENPNSDEKPMVRWWFPDAYAGEDENDMIEEHIQELKEAGYGGAEITMMLSGTQLSNDNLKDYGWGTENWKKLLEKVLIAANAAGDFSVDITITPHWPTVINNIDPNDDAASKEIISQVQKVSTVSGGAIAATGSAITATGSAIIATGTEINLKLPTRKTKDSTDALTSAPFLFTDELVGAYLVKVSAVNGNSYTYDYDSIIPVTEDVHPVSGGGYAAGVPDEATCSELGLNYQTVLDIYGSAPDASADLSVSYNGKMDSEGNRKRLADWQDEYQLVVQDNTAAALLDYTSSEGEAIAAGDYVLIGTYMRGTGQVMSDGPFGGASDAMYSRTYVTNYFSAKGVDAITNYWETHILDDELKALLRANGSSIFEDSIEASAKSGGSFWSDEILNEFNEEYSYKDIIPLIVTQGSSKFTSVIKTDLTDTLGDVEEDYKLALGDLYENVHAKAISNWAKTFNYTYRAQTYTLTGLDITGAASAVDVPEGDNSSKGDGLRKMASAVNVNNKMYYSMEAVTATGQSKLNWADVATEVAQNFSDGVNHVVLHGTPYTKSVNGYISDWPGWTAFGNNFADSYAIWRADWEDMPNLTGYIARNQAVLQTGIAKVDIAFLNDTTTASSLNDGNAFQALLDKGYSYNMFTEALMDSEKAVVKNGVLAEDGPAYKALILNKVSTISSEGLQKVLEYAQAGLPIILYKTDVTDIYGSDSTADSVAKVQEIYNQLTQANQGNVKSAASEEELEQCLTNLGIKPAATYEASKLETSHYKDTVDGSDYYYMYNNVVPSNTGMANGKNLEYKNGVDISATVTLEGDGIPYELDAWTGEMHKIAEYTKNADGTYTLDVALSGGESTIIGILPGTESVHAERSDYKLEYDEKNNIVLKTNVAGNYNISLSDGTTKAVTVAQALDPIDLNSGWSMKLESWEPSDDLDAASNIDTEKTVASSYTVYKNPSLMKISTLDLAINTLGYIKNIEVTADQLNELGVSSMEYISGIAYYSNTFILPDTWTAKTGAVLNFGYSQDMVTEVTVNGVTIDGIDIVSDTLDIGAYLKTGENAITIKLDTPMFNRMRGEERDAVMAGGMNMTGQSTINTGLLSVSLTPYTKENIQVGVTGIIISKTAVSLKVGETETLSAVITPSDASDSSVTWSSSDESIVKVSKTGVTTAVKAGKATITVTSNSNSSIAAACVVTVTSTPAAEQPSTGTTSPSPSTTPTVTPTPTESKDEISSVPVTGTKQADGTFKDGNGNKITSSIVEAADGTNYIVDENGAVIKNAIVTTRDGSRYYTTQSGTVAIKQLVMADGKKYYAGGDGKLVSSKLITVDGKKYYADKTGVIATKKFITVKEAKYYAGNTGVIATKKFITVNGAKYYTGNTGVIATKKFITVNGAKYYAGTTGVIATKKLITVNAKKYYATKSGKLAVSTWVKVGGKSYYCNENGVITKTK